MVELIWRLMETANVIGLLAALIGVRGHWRTAAIALVLFTYVTRVRWWFGFLALTVVICAPASSMAQTYATWNPADKASGADLSNGNMTVTTPSNTGVAKTVRASIGKSTGKWYFEIKADTYGGGAVAHSGIANASHALNMPLGAVDANGWAVNQAGTVQHNGNTGVNLFSAISQGDVINIAIDLDAHKIWFGKNGTWTGQPSLGTGAASAVLSGTLFPAVSVYSGPAFTSLTANFGATTFSNAVPSGFAPGIFTCPDGEPDPTTFSCAAPQPADITILFALQFFGIAIFTLIGGCIAFIFLITLNLGRRSYR